MTHSLVPFEPELAKFTPPKGLEVFRKTFLVPKASQARGVVVYVSGLRDLADSQVMAMALAEGFLCLCSPGGLRWWHALTDINRVRVVDLSDYTVPVQAPDGQMTRMKLPGGKGLSIELSLEIGGIDEILIHTLSPRAAYDWLRHISAARRDYERGADSTSEVI